MACCHSYGETKAHWTPGLVVRGAQHRRALNLQCLSKVQGGLNQDLKLPSHGRQCQQAEIRWESECDLFKVRQSGKTCFPTRLGQIRGQEGVLPQWPVFVVPCSSEGWTPVSGWSRGPRVWKAGFPAWFSWELCGRGQMSLGFSWWESKHTTQANVILRCK